MGTRTRAEALAEAHRILRRASEDGLRRGDLARLMTLDCEEGRQMEGMRDLEVPRLERAADELARAPRREFAGLSRERASRTGAALVERAARTGEWYPLAEALVELRGVMEGFDRMAGLDPRAAEDWRPEFMGH